MRLRGGVHEILPVVILTVLAVAFAFIALGYMVGLWGNTLEGPRNTELLRLGADSVVTWCRTSNGSVVPVLAVQYVNPGLRDTVVYRVDVLGYGWFYVGYVLNYTGSPEECNASLPSLVSVGGYGLVLRQGSSGWFYIVVPDRIASRLHRGLYVDVRLYTRFGSLFLAHVPVR